MATPDTKSTTPAMQQQLNQTTTHVDVFAAAYECYMAALTQQQLQQIISYLLFL